MGKPPIILLILAVLALPGCGLESASANRDVPPYWSSLRYNDANMRVGPSGQYPIVWNYNRAGLPLMVLRTREGWSFVEEIDGTRGWISDSQLLRRRTVLITGEGNAVLRDEPKPTGKLQWRAEAGVIGKLLGCQGNWCEIDAAGRTGWVEASRLWGIEERES